MRMRNIVVVSMVVVAMSAPARAADLPPESNAPIQTSVSRALAHATQEQSEPGSIPKGYLYVGSGLFAAGLTVGLMGFLNNRNGDFPEFGEATSTNVKMGAAGLATAFAGGAILFLGKRQANRSTAVTFGPRAVSVSRRWSW